MTGYAWPRRVKKALERKQFSEEDKRRAANWTSCAISENPRLSLAMDINKLEVKPGDYERAYSLGLKFNQAVKCDKPKEAAKILAKIRSFKL